MMHLAILLITVFIFSGCETNQNNPEVIGGVSSSVENEASVGDSSDESKEDEYLSSSPSPDVIVTDQILEKKLLEVGDRVFFDYNKTGFKNTGVETLKRQANFLSLNKNITVTIEGHCDERGTREYNIALGERRAFSVKNYLVSLGVSENRISVISYGKEKPPVIGNSEIYWSQSRTAITIINQ